MQSNASQNTALDETNSSVGGAVDKKAAYQATDLVADLLGFIEQNWVSVDQVHMMLDRAGYQDISKRILFVQELLKLIRTIPADVFADEGSYSNIISTLQAALDELVEQEEEYL